MASRVKGSKSWPRARGSNADIGTDDIGHDYIKHFLSVTTYKMNNQKCQWLFSYISYSYIYIQIQATFVSQYGFKRLNGETHFVWSRTF